MANRFGTSTQVQSKVHDQNGLLRYYVSYIFSQLLPLFSDDIYIELVCEKRRKRRYKQSKADWNQFVAAYECVFVYDILGRDVGHAFCICLCCVWQSNDDGKPNRIESQGTSKCNECILKKKKRIKWLTSCVVCGSDRSSYSAPYTNIHTHLDTTLFCRFRM